MLRNPLGLRLDPDQPVRDQIHAAARLGAKGVVLDAMGDLAPQRLGETGRREVRRGSLAVQVDDAHTAPRLVRGEGASRMALLPRGAPVGTAKG